MICEIALILAIDISGSVVDRYYTMQRDATAQAIEQVVSPNPYTPMAISVTMWGQINHVVIPWQIIRTREDARRIANQLRMIERPGAGLTNMVTAVNEAIDLFNISPCDAERNIIDVSGDGKSDQPNIQAVRDRAESLQIQINGLPILTDLEPELDKYFRENIMTYDGFVIPSNQWNDFFRSIRNKLTLEIASNIR